MSRSQNNADEPIDYVRVAEMVALIPKIQDVLAGLILDTNSLNNDFLKSLLDQARNGKVWTVKQIDAAKRTVTQHYDWREERARVIY